MTTPRGKQDITASTFDFAGITIAGLIRSTVSPTERLLDVGAGWGKYRWLLPEYEMDAVEIWEPYIRQGRLDAYYRVVHCTDVCRLGFGDRYRYRGVILGDVLEHIAAKPAATLIDRLCVTGLQIWVAVPFQMPQHEEEGNPHEAHLQVDLDREVMAARYPQLELVAAAAQPNGYTKAVYTNRSG